ncbi:hypothetical protein LXA43DRAFT_199061 [Ganoderma leucocontextum]|nr:hypothetical protein LXA43DRAFT_199061 [Ganoderma leucocontextum]
MAPSEDAPLHPPSALGVYTSSRPLIASHILRERISHELAELAVKEKELIDPISRRRLELNRLWNGSLLIHRLPNELFVQIFAHFQDVTCRPPKPSLPSAILQRGPSQPGWHGLMLVCRHWRDVFVSTPTFWRKVDLKRHIDWTNLCLTRSAAASIDVCAGRHDRCSLEVLHPHIHRFTILRLDAQRHHIVSLFKSSMPLLEDLYLNVLEPEVNIDAQLTSQRFPRLRTLVLCGTVAPQETSLFAQLRALSLSCCSYNFSFDTFLDILVTCGRLEELTLKGTLDYLSDEWMHGDPAVPRRPPISLPRLRTFTMEKHEIIRTSRFLAHLHLQPSLILSIGGNFQESDAAGVIPGTVNTISAMLPPNCSTTLPILAIATKVDLVIWGNDYEIGCGNYPGFPYARFALSMDGDPDWGGFMSQGLVDLVECFGRSPLTHLTVKGDHSHGTVEAWERVFRTFPLLEEVDLGGSSGSEVTDVFRGLHAASTAHEDSPVACHNLKQLHVAGLGLVETYAAMKECLRYRSDRGVILQVLNLKYLPDAEGLTPQVRRAFVKDLCKAAECIQAFHGEWDVEQEEGEGEM